MDVLNIAYPLNTQPEPQERQIPSDVVIPSGEFLALLFNLVGKSEIDTKVEIERDKDSIQTSTVIPWWFNPMVNQGEDRGSSDGSLESTSFESQQTKIEVSSLCQATSVEQWGSLSAIKPDCSGPTSNLKEQGLDQSIVEKWKMNVSTGMCEQGDIIEFPTIFDLDLMKPTESSNTSDPIMSKPGEPEPGTHIQTKGGIGKEPATYEFSNIKKHYVTLFPSYSYGLGEKTIQGDSHLSNGKFFQPLKALRTFEDLIEVGFPKPKPITQEVSQEVKPMNLESEGDISARWVIKPEVIYGRAESVRDQNGEVLYEGKCSLINVTPKIKNVPFDKNIEDLGKGNEVKFVGTLFVDSTSTVVLKEDGIASLEMDRFEGLRIPAQVSEQKLYGEASSNLNENTLPIRSMEVESMVEKGNKIESGSKSFKDPSSSVVLEDGGKPTLETDDLDLKISAQVFEQRLNGKASSNLNKTTLSTKQKEVEWTEIDASAPQKPPGLNSEHMLMDHGNLKLRPIVQRENELDRLTGAQISKWISRVEQEISNFYKTGQSQLRIQCIPDELGKIDLRFVSSQERTNVTILAENPSTVQLLDRHLNQLRQSLIDVGINLGDLVVSLGYDHAGQGLMNDMHQPKMKIPFSQGKETELSNGQYLDREALDFADDNSIYLDYKI